ncbi:hypothetical protein SAY87_001380 [Trapa incisa]|uniref:Uncharacterized protein n=1 Tax=Trapa incisa TaxID=236973 RepID=A0AAN7JGX3_9MYRT|nr:hypothetical protein SAY87_001380 [Trapa incisa]
MVKMRLTYDTLNFQMSTILRGKKRVREECKGGGGEIPGEDFDQAKLCYMDMGPRFLSILFHTMQKGLARDQVRSWLENVEPRPTPLSDKVLERVLHSWIKWGGGWMRVIFSRPTSSASFALDEVEDMEITEADVALLRQLLEEFEVEVKGEAKRAESNDAMQLLESTEGGMGMGMNMNMNMNGMKVEGQESFSEEGSFWVEEVAGMDLGIPDGWWFPEDIVGLLQFDVNDVTSTEEMTYSCLWDDS